MDFYKIPPEDLDKVVGFDISSYYDLFKFKGFDGRILMTIVDNMLIDTMTAGELSIGLEDIDKGLLETYKINFAYNTSYELSLKVDYYSNLYIKLAEEEPLIHEDKLKFLLKTIELLNNLKEVFN